MPLAPAGILNAVGASVAMGALVALYLLAKPADKKEAFGAILIYAVLVLGLLAVVSL